MVLYTVRRKKLSGFWRRERKEEGGGGGTLARERAKFHETKSLSSSREFYIERLYGVKDKLNALRSSNFLNRFLIYLVSNSID